MTNKDAIKWLVNLRIDISNSNYKHLPHYAHMIDEICELLEEQETEWEHLWDAPDGTFKGRCKKCGFVHFFIEGRDGQYKFCPECGRAVKLDD